MNPFTPSRMLAVTRLLAAVGLLLGLLALPDPAWAIHSVDDYDGDGVPNYTDNCPLVYNPMADPLEPYAPDYWETQFDEDLDGMGDPCDPDFADDVYESDYLIRYGGGLGLYFVGENREPLRIYQLGNICFNYYLDYPDYWDTVFLEGPFHQCATYGNVPYFRYLFSGNSSTFTPPYSGPETIRLEFDGGGTFVYEFRPFRFDMVALNTNYQVVEPRLWTQSDDDGDGLSNEAETTIGTDPLDSDSDDDGVADGADAFPLDPSESVDSDGDGIGDNADPDDDNDGLSDADEALLGGDPRDPDSDDDGILDGQDQCVTVPGYAPTGCPDIDTDGDGVPDSVDQCPLVFGVAPSGCPAVCTEAAVHTETWRAFVDIPLAWDDELFAIQPYVNYCYSDNYAQITSAGYLPFVDSGFDEFVLSQFGFAPRYLSGQEYGGVFITEYNTHVTMRATFAMCWDVTVLVDKLKIKGYLEDKAQAWLTRHIARQLAKYGGNVNLPGVSEGILGYVDELGANLLAAADEEIEDALPGPIGDFVENAVEGWLQERKQQWEETIRANLAGGLYTNLAADQIAGAIVEEIASEIQAVTEVCSHLQLWKPVYFFSVAPGGGVDSTMEYEYLSPFMYVKQD